MFGCLRNCWPMHGSARRGSNDRWNTQKESSPSPRRGARNSVVSSQECWLFVQFATGEVQVTLNQQGGRREEVCSFALRICKAHAGDHGSLGQVVRVNERQHHRHGGSFQWWSRNLESWNQGSSAGA